MIFFTMIRQRCALTFFQFFRSPIQIGAPFPSHMVDSPYWDTSSKTLPLLSLWQSSRDSGKMASILAERSKRINLNKLHRFQDAGLDEDSLKESIEDLYKLSDCYVEPTDAIWNMKPVFHWFNRTWYVLSLSFQSIFQFD